MADNNDAPFKTNYRPANSSKFMSSKTIAGDPVVWKINTNLALASLSDLDKAINYI